MTATTRGSPVGGNESQEQGQAPDGQSQPPLPQNQVSFASRFTFTVAQLKVSLQFYFLRLWWNHNFKKLILSIFLFNWQWICYPRRPLPLHLMRTLPWVLRTSRVRETALPRSRKRRNLLFLIQTWPSWMTWSTGTLSTHLYPEQIVIISIMCNVLSVSKVDTYRIVFILTDPAGLFQSCQRVN